MHCVSRNKMLPNNSLSAWSEDKLESQVGGG